LVDKVTRRTLNVIFLNKYILFFVKSNHTANTLNHGLQIIAEAAPKKHATPKLLSLCAEKDVTKFITQSILKQLMKTSKLTYIHAIYNASGIYGADGIVKRGSYILILYNGVYEVLKILDLYKVVAIDDLIPSQIILHGVRYAFATETDGTDCPMLQVKQLNAFIPISDHSTKLLQQISVAPHHQIKNQCYLNIYARTQVAIDVNANFTTT